MKKWLFLIHLGVVILFLGAIFGIGFGLINPSVVKINNYQNTLCYYLNHINITYNYYYKRCNTSIPSCSFILSQNISGICYNDTQDELAKYTLCFVVYDIYTILNITFKYYILNNNVFIQNLLYDCNNNQTCISNFPKYIDCYYDKNNPSFITLSVPENYRWEYLAAIVILCFLMLFYMAINLTVFKRYNYFCGKKW